MGFRAFVEYKYGLCEPKYFNEIASASILMVQNRKADDTRGKKTGILLSERNRLVSSKN